MLLSRSTGQLSTADAPPGLSGFERTCLVEAVSPVSYSVLRDHNPSQCLPKAEVQKRRMPARGPE